MDCTLVTGRCVYRVRQAPGPAMAQTTVTITRDDRSEWTYLMASWRPLSAGCGSGLAYLWSARDVVALPDDSDAEPAVLTTDEDILLVFRTAAGWLLVCETSVRLITGHNQVSRVELGDSIEQARWAGGRLRIHDARGTETAITMAGGRLAVSPRPRTRSRTIMTDQAGNSLDLDQVAAALARLRGSWERRGVTAGPLTWRDARTPWPRPLRTDRSMVSEPESVGLTLTAGGREGRLIIWRGGWADIDLLAEGTVTTRNPALLDLADCVAAAVSLASQVAAAAAPDQEGSELDGVSVLWVTDWWDGPVEGMASYQGSDCWFEAIFDEEADEWTSPRRCRLYELNPAERERLWARHRRWEQHAGGNSCYHPDAPPPDLKPGWRDFYDHDDPPARVGRQLGEFTAPPLALPEGRQSEDDF